MEPRREPTLQYVERAPKPTEIPARGPHHATVTFEIVNPNEYRGCRVHRIGTARAKGTLRFEATRFQRGSTALSSENLTGQTCDETITPDGPSVALDRTETQRPCILKRDVIFRGGEFQSQLDVMRLWNGTGGGSRRSSTSCAPLSPTAPMFLAFRRCASAAAGLVRRQLRARVHLRHAFPQNESRGTGGKRRQRENNKLEGRISYRWRSRQVGEWRHQAKMTVGVARQNLVNENIRNAESFKKYQVLMPGRGVRVSRTRRFRVEGRIERAGGLKEAN